MLDGSKSQVEHTGSRRKLRSVHGVCLLLPIQVCAKQMVVDLTGLDRRKLPINQIKPEGLNSITYFKVDKIWASPSFYTFSLQDSFDCPHMGNMQRSVVGSIDVCSDLNREDQTGATTYPL